jgi:putative cell wall-binding protein
VGGTASVAASVTEGLARDFGFAKVTRVAGADRYAGSRALIMHPAFGAPTSPYIYLATGADFPDALAASPAAVSVNAPVMLVDGSKPALSDAEKAVLRDLRVTGVRIAGGGSSVSVALESSLRGGSWSVDRFSGVDRHAGSVALNQVFGTADTVYLASSALFPDALSGAPAASRLTAPIYLVPRDCVPNVVLADVARLRASKVVVLGGTGTLGAEIDRLKPC